MASEVSEVKAEPSDSAQLADQSDNNNGTNNANDAQKLKIEQSTTDEQVINESGNNEASPSQEESTNGTAMRVDSDQNEVDDSNNVVEQGDDEEVVAGGDDDDGGGDGDEESDENKTNLIVNYLPQQMTDEEFEALFTKFGPMKSCKIVRNRMTKYSYGFGFVDFETHEQAIKAIEELNGHKLDTKNIKVAFARPAGQDIKQANLYVKNIPPTWTQDDVRKEFESFGNIIQVRVLENRGIAFVLYDLRRQAEIALEEMNGKQLEGVEEPMEVKFAADKKSKQTSTKSSRRGRGGGDGTGRTRERGNRGGVNRNRNRSQSDTRHRSQPRGPRGMSNQRGGNNRPNDNFNNNNNNGNNNNNNGFGPTRHQSSGRMNRFAPFAPVHQQAPQQMQPVVAPMAAAYGYPQQPMYPYMLAGHQQPQAPMMPYASAGGPAGAPGQAQMGGQMANPMGPYQMAAAVAASNPQMSQMGYGTQAAAAAAAQAMNNMYSMASNTMQNAAQMQPQLGQPMSNQMRGNQSGGANSSGGSNSNDGITLFVYNIGPQSDESELKSMFAPYGQVLRCNVVRKTPGGETKGFGFVTLKDRAQANAAISSLNGSPRNGKTLQVSLKK